MLSNNTCLETRIQRLLDVLIFDEKGLGVHVQRMLKMSRSLYTGGHFWQNTLKKAKEKWGPYLRSWFDKLAIWCQLIFYLNILCDHCLHDYHLYSRKMLTNRERVNYQKWDFFSIFLYTFTINVVTTGARKKPIEYMFCFIYSQQCIKIISTRKMCGFIKKISSCNCNAFRTVF